MVKKPGYEELMQKVESLKKQIQEQKVKEGDLFKENSELKKIKKYYDILMNNTEDYFLINDKTGVPIAFNASYKKRMKKVLGIEIHPGMKIKKFTNRRDEKYWISQHDRVLNGEKFVAEFSAELDNGEILYYETLFCPVTEDGEVTGFTEITRNITKHKRLEAVLKASEHKYRALFEGMLEACALHELIFDENGEAVDFRYLDVNPAFEKVTGFSAEEIVGRTISEMVPDADPFLSKTYTEVAITGEPIYFDYFLGNKDKYYMISAYQPEKNQFVCIFQDITERKKTEENLKKAHDEMEKRVTERTKDLKASNKALYEKTIDLEDVNTALKVLLERRDKDKEEVGEKVLLNVKELLDPHLRRLKKTSLTDNQKNYVELLETGLREIVSPFAKRLTSRYMNITPGEMSVASLIKEGKTSKEIAEILNSTERAVVAHRLNIRKKLGLDRKANLRTYLISLS